MNVPARLPEEQESAGHDKFDVVGMGSDGEDCTVLETSAHLIPTCVQIEKNTPHLVPLPSDGERILRKTISRLEPLNRSEKRQRTGAVQDANAPSGTPRPRDSVVEWASPLALSQRLTGARLMERVSAGRVGGVVDLILIANLQKVQRSIATT